MRAPGGAGTLRPPCTWPRAAGRAHQPPSPPAALHGPSQPLAALCTAGGRSPRPHPSRSFGPGLSPQASEPPPWRMLLSLLHASWASVTWCRQREAVHRGSGWPRSCSTRAVEAGWQWCRGGSGPPRSQPRVADSGGEARPGAPPGPQAVAFPHHLRVCAFSAPTWGLRPERPPNPWARSWA